MDLTQETGGINTGLVELTQETGGFNTGDWWN